MRVRKVYPWFIAALLCILSLQISVMGAETRMETVSSADTLHESTTTKGFATEKATLAAPKMKSIKNIEKGVQLTWNKVSKAKGYLIGGALPGEEKYTLLKTIKSKKTLNYIHTKAVSGQLYYYGIQSFAKSSGKKVYSKINSYYNIFLSTPSSPTLKSVENGVQITWKKIKGATFYKIYRWDAGGSSAKLLGTVSSRYNSTIDKYAEHGKTYKYGVVAGIEYGEDDMFFSSSTVHVSTITYENPDDDEDYEDEDDFDESTIYRAYLIGNSEYSSPLPNPPFDVTTMYYALQASHYSVKTAFNLKAIDILNGIKDAFRDATSKDVSLIYFSGKGYMTGNYTGAGGLIGVDKYYISFASLAKLCKTIPGRVIFILDSNSSGSSIKGANQSGKAKDGKSLADLLIQAFKEEDVKLVDKRSDLMVSNKFYVLASSEDFGYALYNNGTGFSYGLFTCSLCAGVGYYYDNPKKWDGSMGADSNKDNYVTLEEFYKYVYPLVNKLSYEQQHVQRYPVGSRQVVYWR